VPHSYTALTGYFRDREVERAARPALLAKSQVMRPAHSTALCTSASWHTAFAGAVRSRAILFGSSPTAAHSGLTLRSTTFPSGDTALTRLEVDRAPPDAGGSATRLRLISPQEGRQNLGQPSWRPSPIHRRPSTLCRGSSPPESTWLTKTSTREPIDGCGVALEPLNCVETIVLHAGFLDGSITAG